MSSSPNAGANGTRAFSSGPCPWVYGTFAGQWQSWALWTSTQWLVFYTNFGGTVSQLLGASITCTGANLSGSAIMPDGTHISFGA